LAEHDDRIAPEEAGVKDCLKDQLLKCHNIVDSVL
jgi:hypothetical protein